MNILLLAERTVPATDACHELTSARMLTQKANLSILDMLGELSHVLGSTIRAILVTTLDVS